MEIHASRLCKAYNGTPVLSGLSFTLCPGITRVEGPSGSGKTTLLRLLMGLEQPDSGTHTGSSIRWAAVFQEDRLLEQLNAEQNLRFVLGAAYSPARVSELLKELGLADAGSKPVREYSGGMKRRLALARALLAPSDAVVLDEPFTGLDADNRAAALRCILKYTAGKPVLLASHEPLALPEDCCITVKTIVLVEAP